jgi:Flp pilus assembly protein TadB
LSGLFEKVIIAILLFTGFFNLFFAAKKQKFLALLIRKTGENLSDASEKRLVRNRENLMLADSKRTWWSSIENELRYSGLMAKLPTVTVEIFIASNVVVFSIIFIVTLVYSGILSACMAVIISLVAEMFIFRTARMKNIRRVNDNLLKFLDFLGSYSITSGELTGILGQIGRYVDEPLKSALEECCYEAQTTGDTGMALLAMAEKIEHPQFKELARNMEINVRYCADFSALVSGSRRGMRDYQRSSQERKNMLREAAVNMMLLLVMSVFSLIIVDGLIEESIWKILIYSLPGRLALAVTTAILLLFMMQIYKN